jgi:hypothetical protein
MEAGAAIDQAQFTSRRRRLHRRVLLFSIVSAVAVLLVAGLVLWVIEIYTPLKD